MKEQASPPRSFSPGTVSIAMYILVTVTRRRNNTVESALRALKDLLHIQGIPAGAVGDLADALWMQIEWDEFITLVHNPALLYPTYRLTKAGRLDADGARVPRDVRAYFADWDEQLSIHQVSRVVTSLSRIVRQIPGRVPRKVREDLLARCAEALAPRRTRT